MGPADRIRRRPVLGNKENIMSVRRLHAAAAAALPGGFGLVTPAAAQSRPSRPPTMRTP